jgi:alpha-N-arabinofuranosidase
MRTNLSSWTKDNSIVRVASGANSFDYNWTEVVMKNVPKTLIEGMALHHYSVIDWAQKGSATVFDEKAYFTTMQRALQMEELVTKHAAIMDKYDAEKKVALIVDEWGGWYEVEKGTNPGFLYQQNTIRDAMIAGVTLNIFNNHADRVRMANLAQAINVLQSVILTKGNKMLLTPTYHVMEMYNVHQDATLIPLEIKNVDYSIGKDALPTISASASKAKDGKVHISLVNIDAKNTREVTLDLKELKAKVVTGRILTSGKIQDYNSFETPDAIKPADFKNTTIKQGRLTLKLPPVSVVVLELS